MIRAEDNLFLGGTITGYQADLTSPSMMGSNKGIFWDEDATVVVTELGFTGLSVTCILNSMLMQINYFFRIDIFYSCTYNIRRDDYIKQLCEKN
jgi:hypothetical protein